MILPADSEDLKDMDEYPGPMQPSENLPSGHIFPESKVILTMGVK